MNRGAAASTTKTGAVQKMYRKNTGAVQKIYRCTRKNIYIYIYYMGYLYKMKLTQIRPYTLLQKADEKHNNRNQKSFHTLYTLDTTQYTT